MAQVLNPESAESEGNSLGGYVPGRARESKQKRQSLLYYHAQLNFGGQIRKALFPFKIFSCLDLLREWDVL